MLGNSSRATRTWLRLSGRFRLETQAEGRWEVEVVRGLGMVGA